MTEQRYLIEYAQFRNGEFVAWQDGGLYESRELALKAGAARGYTTADLEDTWRLCRAEPATEWC